MLASAIEEPTAEEAGAAPVSPYAAAKLASTGYARVFHALYGLHVVPARIGMVYAQRQSDVIKLVPHPLPDRGRGRHAFPTACACAIGCTSKTSPMR